MNLYNYQIKDIDGNIINFEDFRGKTLLIVNTASKCDFTPQYADLQKLSDRYASKDFLVLGFPCDQFANQEFNEGAEIKTFCAFNYGVTFPIFEKVNVNGSDAHPLFQELKDSIAFTGLDMTNPSNRIIESVLKDQYPTYLLGNAIRWNFTKFLINKEGQVVKRFESTTEPLEIEAYIEAVL